MADRRGLRRARVRALMPSLVAASLGVSVLASSAVAADSPPTGPVGSPRPAVKYDPQLYPFTKVTDSPVSEPGKEPGAQLMKDARTQAEDQLIQANAAKQARQAPAQVAARRASRTKFAGLDRAGAVRLARRTFPTLLSGPSAGALSSGQRASQYIDQYTAVVKGGAPDGGNATVISSTPLRAKTANGTLAPVDVTLKQATGGWSATNPLEAYTIASKADNGVTFPDLGLSVRPVADASAGQVADKTVFYPDTQTDTDTIVKPLTSGVEYAWQLRSADAPERLSLDVDLPAGASLGQPGRDGVRVVKDGRTIGRLDTPTASDADGQIVPSHLEVDGNRITIVVEHVGKDVAYPIAVDPDFVAGFYFTSYGLDAFNYWASYNSSGKYTLFGGDFWYGRGLYIQSANYPQEPTPYVFIGGGPGSGDHAGFYFNAPGNAHIWKAYSSVSRHILGASLAHCMIVGIAGPDLNSWEGPYGTTYGEGCAPFALYSWNVTIPGQGGTASNAFIFGDYAYSNNQTAVDSYTGDVELWMSDPDAPHGPPGFAGPQVMAPHIPPEYNTNADDPISAVAYDDSSGVASITFYGPASWTYNGMNGASGITVNNPACAYGVCSHQFTGAVPIGNMPDGQQTIWAYARDASGQYSPASYAYTLNFDSTPPQAPSGFTIAKDPYSGSAFVDWESSPDVLSGISTWKVRYRPQNGTWSAWITQSTDQIEIPNAVEGDTWEVQVVNVDGARNESATADASLVVPPAFFPVDSEEGDAVADDADGSLTSSDGGALGTSSSADASVTPLAVDPTQRCATEGETPGQNTLYSVRTIRASNSRLRVQWSFRFTYAFQLQVFGINPFAPAVWTSYRRVNGTVTTQDAHHGVDYWYHGSFFVDPGDDVEIHARVDGDWVQGRTTWQLRGRFDFRCRPTAPTD